MNCIIISNSGVSCIKTCAVHDEFHSCSIFHVSLGPFEIQQVSTLLVPSCVHTNLHCSLLCCAQFRAPLPYWLKDNKQLYRLMNSIVSFSPTYIHLSRGAVLTYLLFCLKTHKNKASKNVLAVLLAVIYVPLHTVIPASVIPMIT